MTVLGLVSETKRLPRLAVLVPCFNESLTIGQVIGDFRAALPTAQIYVYDNNSTDGTAEIARAAGAIVRVEPRQGKGNVVRRMFGDIEADIYILVDGDGTYDAKAAPFLVGRVLKDDLDFVNGARAEVSQQAYRRGHRLGNRVLTGLVQGVFGREFRDMLSGYKVMSRRFVKSFPAMSSGFETETELVVHALELRMPAAEITTAYQERPEGSVSKLRTYRDGARILYLILRLMKDERPLQFFGTLSAALLVAALMLVAPVVVTFAETGLVPRLPTAVLSLGIVILSVLTLFTGIVLDLTTRTRQELKRLLYLSVARQLNVP
ncbi:glycosyltransferase [Methylobacterium sp. yr668]|uniref:glycosyltransferase n=1 Tax=Methylobacterium sp. yr668 TaxID=1761801 RepID=UPI0008E784C1|nr:glycosyltransferase [Methylobacterium sp. yr668]SFT29761.1 Glycosyltransferase involved in cell wall bisynthesis [Methylobacterium sp. yr668]